MKLHVTSTPEFATLTVDCPHKGQRDHILYRVAGRVQGSTRGKQWTWNPSVSYERGTVKISVAGQPACARAGAEIELKDASVYAAAAYAEADQAVDIMLDSLGVPKGQELVEVNADRLRQMMRYALALNSK